MNYKHKLMMTLLGVGLLINFIVGAAVYSRETNKDNDEEALRRLSTMMRVMMLIRQNYVEPDETDYETLINHALRGMLSELDPYSAFLEPREYQDMIESTEGKFGGVGLIVSMRDGVLTVVSPIDDTPAEEAGIQAGDQITQIDQEKSDGMTLREAVSRIKGDPGTKVELEIFRPETEETIIVEIERAIIEVSSVKDERMLDDSIAYLRITQFDETTSDNLEEILEQLSEQGMQALVIDLRNNPGGLLTAAVRAASHFLEPGQLVVSTEGRRPAQAREHKTVRLRRHLDIPLAVLINRGSASGSEIMAGALSDHGRAVLIGDTSFGKGSVQSVINLPDNHALRLTTAHYYTPENRLIHEQGIEPDIKIELSSSQLREVRDKRRQAEEEQRELEVEADPQLAKALETLQEKIKEKQTAAAE